MTKELYKTGVYSKKSIFEEDFQKILEDIQHLLGFSIMQYSRNKPVSGHPRKLSLS